MSLHHTFRSFGEQSPIRWSELERYGSVEISDEADDTVGDFVRRVITDSTTIVAGSEPALDAPPFTADYWWLATVRTDGDHVALASLEPRDAYGIDSNGHVHFAYPRELPVAAVVRAIDEGHYSSTEHVLVVTRAGEFGGNGHAVSSLVVWLLQEFPLILLGVGLDVRSPVVMNASVKTSKNSQRNGPVDTSCTRCPCGSSWSPSMRGSPLFLHSG